MNMQVKMHDIAERGKRQLRTVLALTLSAIDDEMLWLNFRTLFGGWLTYLTLPAASVLRL